MISEARQPRGFVRALAAVLAVAASMAAGDAAAAGATLRFGTDPTYPPYEYKTPDGRLAGLDIDIGNALCAAAQVRCVWVESSFDGLVAGLAARKFDAIDASMAPTAARRRVMDFSQPLYAADIRLVAARDRHLTPDPTSLAGKRIGVLQGSTQAAFVKANWEPRGVVMHEYADQNSIYADLANGRLDGTLALGTAARLGFLDKPQGARFALSGLRIDDPAIIGASSVIGVRKGDAQTLQLLDAALARLKADGTIARLERQYLGAQDGAK
ncbi:transporter substrate-binding domain-containing protein [Burkholderia stabilis]|uniref:Solute-binding protein family 3/N-terminal domain-containing protein n=1 Tax=Burkholderia stabilis TaxID=95485 RepID=A0AAJ5NC20_9BURK|nr:transporter substrate-binding domain-containing protein [Burkholderia stabilis]VBB15758.1 Lysine-arginine-ornithine-binding periplasmic protein precursor,ABC transporter lysine/arginine/ornithine binding periplasmic protein,lysine-arginine-ornithine-binding periplasmic protein,Bacterial extracellular solute-binding proteins, family 3 [Burkholderia stabilis]